MFYYDDHTSCFKYMLSWQKNTHKCTNGFNDNVMYHETNRIFKKHSGGDVFGHADVNLSLHIWRSVASRPSPNCDLLRLLQLHAGIQHISSEPSDRIHSQDPFDSLMSRNFVSSSFIDGRSDDRAATRWIAVCRRGWKLIVSPVSSDIGAHCWFLCLLLCTQAGWNWSPISYQVVLEQLPVRDSWKIKMKHFHLYVVVFVKAVTYITRSSAECHVCIADEFFFSCDLHKGPKDELPVFRGGPLSC